MATQRVNKHFNSIQLMKESEVSDKVSKYVYGTAYSMIKNSCIQS